MAKIVSNICGSNQRENRHLFVIDAGDGKGYLSTRLSVEHNIKVLGVDFNPTNTLSALVRSEKLGRCWDGMKTQAQTIPSSDQKPSNRKTRRNERKRQQQLKTCNLENVEKSTDLIQKNYRNATHFITPNTDFVELFNKNFDMDASNIPGLCLSGLHTCGNLASSCLKIYCENSQISAVCNIGCCYHLITEQFNKSTFNKIHRERSPMSKSLQIHRENEDDTNGFPLSRFLIETETELGRNARMLACQSIHRVINKRELSNKHLFYRSLLEKLIERKCPEYMNRIEVGRIKQCETFSQYVQRSNDRNPWLKFDDENITENDSTVLHDEFRMDELYLDLYHLLRISLASVVESIILLDRLLYLKENELIQNESATTNISYLVRFFDPVISPRCYGLIAIKNFQET